MQIDTTNFNMTISIVALFAVALIWWDIKQSFKEDLEKQKHEKEEKEVKQGVLLSYTEYTSLLAFKHLCEYNAEEKIKERQDKEYRKEPYEFQ